MTTVSTPPDFDHSGDDGRRTSFTSWKLDMINTLLLDPRLQPSDFKVAVAVLQFMNGETGMIFPSQETIAEIVHMTVRNVGKCLKRLRQADWLSWERGNRQMSNRYVFETKNLNLMLEYRTSIIDNRRERAARRRQPRLDRNGSSSHKVPLGTTVPAATGTTVPLPTGTTIPPNTYMEHLDGTPEEERGIEREPLDSQYAARGKG